MRIRNIQTYVFLNSGLQLLPVGGSGTLAAQNAKNEYLLQDRKRGGIFAPERVGCSLRANQKNYSSPGGLRPQDLSGGKMHQKP